ncbi:Putative ribosomal N-acetyltransferase YdaF [Planctomycetes bacterium Poly30]|uniref:Ribosomal N-acetyltransferase YdaF n=1 Tax=Saltatorellus ferox TaxID=2528018 RepID=A0A518EMI1_9BACT|nr:Putative ribosomal N-acetyltransferase YdaF [Planctomycetes bacterium Poly30]
MQSPALELLSDRLFVQVPAVAAAPRMVDYCLRNRDHLTRWEPPRSNEYYTRRFWEQQFSASRAEFEQGHSVRSVLIRRDPDAPQGGRSGPIVGVINLSQIVRGGFQAGIVGYSLDSEHQGLGLMREGLERLIEYAFLELGLHRVMANYRPENERSARVLESLGFEREGFAREYLYIDGAWRDHVLTSLIRPDRGLRHRSATSNESTEQEEARRR